MSPGDDWSCCRPKPDLYVVPDRFTFYMPPSADLIALGARYELTAAQEGLLRALLDALSQSPWAPTTVADPHGALDVHIADSLTALELPVLSDRAAARAVADLGAGAGFPGLALAAVLERSRFRLLESQQRKASFIAGLAQDAGIVNAEAVFTRIEDWREGIARQDLVTARAVASAPVVLEYAAPLLRTGGSLIEWRGRRDARAEDEAAGVARLLGLERREIRRVRPFAGSRDHHLHLYEKVSPTPEKFPRRPGVARRRPLSPAPSDR